MANQLLLLEDVENVGRSGDIVTVKPGYSRNYLLPKKKAVIADKYTLKLQERLREERLKKATQDEKESGELATHLQTVELSTKVKSDVEGRLYGSVSVADIVSVLKEAGFALNKKNVQLTAPIKKVGNYTIELKLNEGVPATFKLEVLPESGKMPEPKAEAEAAEGEATPEVAEEEASPAKEEEKKEEAKEE